MSPDFLRYWRQHWQLIYKPAFRAQLQPALIKWSLIIVKGLVGQQAQLCLPVPNLLCTSQTLQTTNQTLTKCMFVLESVVCKYDSFCVCQWEREREQDEGRGVQRVSALSYPYISVLLHTTAQHLHNHSQNLSQTHKEKRILTTGWRCLCLLL